MIKSRIDIFRVKVKIRLNKSKQKVKLKKENNVLLSTRNLISDKLNISYISAFRIKEVKRITVLLELLDTKIYL